MKTFSFSVPSSFNDVKNAAVIVKNAAVSVPTKAKGVALKGVAKVSVKATLKGMRGANKQMAFEFEKKLMHDFIDANPGATYADYLASQEEV